MVRGKMCLVPAVVLAIGLAESTAAAQSTTYHFSGQSCQFQDKYNYSLAKIQAPA